MTNQDNTSELRIKEILMAYKRYPYGTAEEPHITGDEAADNLVQFITAHTNKAIADVLDRLESDLENTPLAYAKDTGNERNAWNTISVHEAIESERQKLTNKEVK